MYGWSFAARTSEELGCLLRALNKHRYLRQVDLRLHWAVDLALGQIEPELFGPRAAAFVALQQRRADLDLGSRDPELWSAATADEVAAALSLFWKPSPQCALAQGRLAELLRGVGVPVPTHPPFEADPDEAPHPELFLLDWVLVSVDQLDTERHAGALRAMEVAQEEVSASDEPCLEAMPLSEAELCGARNGVIPSDFMIWADGAYSYCDYVFRGVARSAKLVDPPCGYRDVDKE